MATIGYWEEELPEDAYIRIYDTDSKDHLLKELTREDLIPTKFDLYKGFIQNLDEVTLVIDDQNLNIDTYWYYLDTNFDIKNSSMYYYEADRVTTETYNGPWITDSTTLQKLETLDRRGPGKLNGFIKREGTSNIYDANWLIIYE